MPAADKKRITVLISVMRKTSHQHPVICAWLTALKTGNSKSFVTCLNFIINLKAWKKQEHSSSTNVNSKKRKAFLITVLT